MNGKQYVGRRVSRFESYGPVREVTGIALAVDADNEYRAGDETGYVMQIDCPYGSQAMADDLLAALGGKSYIGYTAENAVMDPEAELGDGVTVGGIYSLLASRRIAFGAGHAASIGAPGESDLDREYGPGEGLAETIQRKLAQTRSYIDKTAEEIRMGVEGVSGEVSELSVTVGGISQTVKDLNGNVSELSVAVGSIDGKVQGLSGEVSELSVAVGSITLKVTGSLGGQASIELSNGSKGSLDLSGVRSAFANDNSSVTISGGTVTFNSNTFVVNSTNFSVTREGRITATAGSIAGWTIGTKALYKDLSSFTGSGTGAYIGTDGIRFTDREGTAALSGGMVTANTVDADYVIAPQISINGIGNGLTCWTASGDDIWLTYASDNYRDVLPGATCVVLGYKNPTRINGTAINMQTTPTYGSDRDVKRDIALMPERYLRLLDELRPAVYRYRWESGDAPLHCGYIAQEMEQAIARAGLTRAEVAALSGTDGTGQMAIGYTELIPVLHLKINALEARIRKLEGAA